MTTIIPGSGDIAEIIGPVSTDPTRSAWHVRLHDGTVAVRTITSSSSKIIDETLAEYREVFEILSRE